MLVGGLRHFTSGQTRYPFFRRMGPLQGQPRRMGKISPPPGFERQMAQSVEVRYTDYLIHYRDSSVIKYKLAYLQASLEAYILCLAM